MNIQKIAEFLLERRHRASPIVLNGEVIEAIESEGLQEALLRRWLVADVDTGNLQVTSSPVHVQEMEAVAKSPPAETRVAESAATSIIWEHAHRGRIDEIGAPGTGKPGPTMGTPTRPSTPASSPAPPAPAPTTPSSQENTLGVGDDVMVAQEGKTYTGKVSALTPQGRYRVSFGPERPSMTRDYESNEVRRVGHAAP